jgi:hypothetical protein
MIKDRDQKGKALQFCLTYRWFPQLELEVAAGAGLASKTAAVTDLDVFASIPDQFVGYRSVVFDCKTKAKESAVNRALWLMGVMERMDADQGFCILKKGGPIHMDHRLMAGKRGVVLLSEDEFDLYAKTVQGPTPTSSSHIGQLDSWDRFNDIRNRFPTLSGGVLYARTAYWMIEDATEACRKTLAMLRSLSAELDPAQTSHAALFMDLCALFSRSFALVVCQLFKAYLHPASSSDLSEALLVMLYGGREAYEHRNELYKMVKARGSDTTVPDLSLPEWDRFLRLARQLLDAPVAVQNIPLILREVGFAMLNGDNTFTFAKALCAESPQAARFCVLVTDYLSKAARLPPEFGKLSDNALIGLQPVK